MKVFRAGCRKKLNLPEEDDYGLKTKIAKALNINPNLVSGWYKKSFPNPENLIQIYNVLGISPNELLGITESKTKELPSPASVADLVDTVKTVIETEDFVSFPIQTFGSAIQSGGQFSGQVIIHKRVFGRRKNLTAVQLNGGVAIVGK